MNKTIKKNITIERRHNKIRAKISGTADRPRLSVFKSNKNISVQLIDDSKGSTLASYSTIEAKGKTQSERAKEVGVEIAKKALALKIKKVVFDRGGYLYSGKIKVVADAAREGGLEF